MAVHALEPVVCAAEGDIRFEWGCRQDERGACSSARHAADASGDDFRGGRALGEDQPAPCRNVPVGENHDQAHHLLVQARQGGHAEFMLPPVMMVMLPPPMLSSPVRSGETGPDAIARPPDVLVRLSTIVLIV